MKPEEYLAEKQCNIPAPTGVITLVPMEDALKAIRKARDEIRYKTADVMLGNTYCISNKPDVKVYMYDLDDEHGSWLARVILTSEGLFMTYSEWGNFFHYFNAPGKEGIRQFMLGIHDDYFAGKLCEVEWNTSTTKVRAAAKRYVQHVLPVLKIAIKEQLEAEKVNL